MWLCTVIFQKLNDAVAQVAWRMLRVEFPIGTLGIDMSCHVIWEKAVPTPFHQCLSHKRPSMTSTDVFKQLSNMIHEINLS